LVLDYATPALDASHPDVTAFLRREFDTLDAWGFEYYKFDGEHAIPRYAPAVDTTRLHDTHADPLVVYRDRLRTIRAAIGPDRFIEGCPAGTPMDGVGYFNSYFNGQDVYDSWQGMYALFSSINANAFFNHLVAYVMPGEGMSLSPTMTVDEAAKKRGVPVIEVARDREDPLKGFGTTLAEARTIVSLVALSGVAYPLGSVMWELPPERVDLIKKTLPTLPILPADLYSRGTNIRWDTFKHTSADQYVHTYPAIVDLKIRADSGVYDVVGLTNWRGAPVRRELAFVDQLGLPAGADYLVFDFWNRKLLGRFSKRIAVRIEPHDTRVLAIHRALDHPQLIGIARHISGAYSVIDLEWDADAGQLRGSARREAGDPYSMYVHVTGGYRLSSTAAVTRAGRAVPVEATSAEDLLEVTIAGTTDIVDWRLTFERQRND
jgi:hypothetical protein